MKNVLFLLVLFSSIILSGCAYSHPAYEVSSSSSVTFGLGYSDSNTHIRLRLHERRYNDGYYNRRFYDYSPPPTPYYDRHIEPSHGLMCHGQGWRRIRGSLDHAFIRECVIHPRYPITTSHTEKWRVGSTCYSVGVDRTYDNRYRRSIYVVTERKTVHCDYPW